MAKMKLIFREPATYDRGKPGVMFTYQDKSGNKLRYALRAGKKGTGRLVTSASCAFGYMGQKQAMDKMNRAANGIEILQEMYA